MNESAEMYLETILVLQKKYGAVRSIDIAKEMGYSRPTVSIAVKKLKEDNCIIVQDNGSIILSEKGLETANKMYERHELISKLLTKLGVDPEIADRDSCKIEHVISPETFECLKVHYSNLTE